MGSRISNGACVVGIDMQLVLMLGESETMSRGVVMRRGKGGMLWRNSVL